MPEKTLRIAWNNMVFSKQEDFQRLYNACVAFAKSYTYDRAAAESIASESMLIFWEKHKNLDAEVPVLPYLLGIARNVTLHYLRSEQLRSSHINELTESSNRDLQYRMDTLQECDPHALFNEDIMRIISDTLEDMGDNARKAFILSRYKGLTYKEISAALMISEKTVEYHISRVLTRLKKALKDYLPLVALLLSI